MDDFGIADTDLGSAVRFQDIGNDCVDCVFCQGGSLHLVQSFGCHASSPAAGDVSWRNGFTD